MFQDLVAVLHRPLAGHQHVHRNEPTGRGLSRAQGMKLNPFVSVIGEYVLDRLQFAAPARPYPSVRTPTAALRPYPVHRILTATAIATSGSRRCQPVSVTKPTPRMTPAEVQTSVIRCRASASSVIELYCLPADSSTRATPKLIAEATAHTARPIPVCSSGWGCDQAERPPPRQY